VGSDAAFPPPPGTLGAREKPKPGALDKAREIPTLPLSSGVPL